MPIPKTNQDWKDLLFQISPLSMKSQAVPRAQLLGSSVNQLLTGNKAIPQAATDVGYAMRGALNYNPAAGGFGVRQIIPQAGANEPTTAREKAIQDVSQGLYGMALTAPLMTAGNVGAGLTKAVTQTLPKTIGYAAGIGSTIQMGKNVLGGQIPQLKPGGGIETLRGLTAGVPESAARSVQYGIKLAPLMQGVQVGIQAIASHVPALNQLTEQGIQALKPTPGVTTGEWFKQMGQVGLARLVRATLLETPLESLVYGVANKMPKENLIKSIEREVLPNLIYNVGYAGMATADDAASTLQPAIKDAVVGAIARLNNPLPSQAAAGQEGFIAGPSAPGFKKGAQYVPLTEGEGAVPRVMMTDKYAKFNPPEDLMPSSVGEVLQHPSLYKQYPDAANVPVEFDPTTNESTTYFIGRWPDRIVLGTKDRTATEMQGDLLHEIQHTIQIKEGFAGGTNMAPSEPGVPGGNEYRNWANYMTQPGEAEGRAVARMQNVPQSKLGTFDPYEGDQFATRKLDIPEETGTIRAMKNIPGKPIGMPSGSAKAKQDATWVLDTLANDQESGDQELKQYFVENGLSEQGATKVLQLRPQFLTDPWASMEGSPVRNQIEEMLGAKPTTSPIPGVTTDQLKQAQLSMDRTQAKNIPSRDIEGEILQQEQIKEKLMALQDKTKSFKKVDSYQQQINGIDETIDSLRAEREAGFQEANLENKKAIADFQASPWKKQIDSELRRRWEAGDTSTDNLPGPPSVAKNIPKSTDITAWFNEQTPEVQRAVLSDVTFNGKKANVPEAWKTTSRIPKVETFAKTTEWTPETTRKAVMTVDAALEELESYGGVDAGLPRAKVLRASIADAWNSLLDNQQISPEEQQSMFGENRLREIQNAITTHFEATAPKKVPVPSLTRQQYIDQFGEDPVDMFGKDWKKVVGANTAKNIPSPVEGITEADVKAYEAVRRSGITNMWDVKTVGEITGMPKDKLIKIMENYGALSDAFLSQAKNIPKAPILPKR